MMNEHKDFILNYSRDKLDKEKIFNLFISTSAIVLLQEIQPWQSL